eukprot:759189-Hanusia_phi.AAC.2
MLSSLKPRQHRLIGLRPPTLTSLFHLNVYSFAMIVAPLLAATSSIIYLEYRTLTTYSPHFSCPLGENSITMTAVSSSLPPVHAWRQRRVTAWHGSLGHQDTFPACFASNP